MSLITFKDIPKILTFCLINFFLGSLHFSLGRVKDFSLYYINYYNEISVEVLLIKMFKIPVCLDIILLVRVNNEVLYHFFIFRTILNPPTKSLKLDARTDLDLGS